MLLWPLQMVRPNRNSISQSLRFHTINVSEASEINNLICLEDRISYLLDKEDEETVVEDSLEGF